MSNNIVDLGSHRNRKAEAEREAELQAAQVDKEAASVRMLSPDEVADINNKVRLNARRKFVEFAGVDPSEEVAPPPGLDYAKLGWVAAFYCLNNMDLSQRQLRLLLEKLVEKQ